jgi:hypothetical protein
LEHPPAVSSSMCSQSPRRERRVDTDGCRHSEDCLSKHRTLSQLAENDEYNTECD